MTQASDIDGRHPKPRMTIRPRRGWLPANPEEIWDSRGLLMRFAAKDIKLRYRQTALGVVWVILQPLLAAGILSFVFGSVAKLAGPPGISYLVFSFTGMVAWTAFSQVTTRASAALVSNATLVSKVFFPRVLLPLSTVLSVLLDVAISLGVLALLLIAYGISPDVGILLVPIWLLLILSASIGIGMCAGALMVRYRDVQFVLPVAIQFLLYASPVAYALDAVPRRARAAYELNPLTGLLEGFRWSVLGTTAPSARLLTYAVISSALLLIGGVLFFTRMERQFADVI